MEDIATELCAVLFTEFRRYDQRIRARQYVDGLLSADGRKSIANIASAVGVPRDTQRLHHFVSSSRWEWTPLRRALARFLETTGPASAWVLKPVSIRKTGEHSVGVGRHFSPDTRQLVNGQQAYGMWFASPRVTAPVSWRLRLTGRWCDEAAADAGPRDSVAGLLEDVRRWGDPLRPALLDVRGVPEEERLVARHLADGFPLVTRIGGRVRVTADHPALGGHGRRAAPAQRILDRALRLRHTRPATGAGGPETAFVTAPVRLAGQGPGGGRPLTALGVWHDLRRPPAQVWLTNVRALSAPAFLNLTRLSGRVEQGWRTRGEAVGLRDFEGRSLEGWHRHMTLASCAYAISALRSVSAVGQPVYGEGPEVCGLSA
ncbi:transposase [Streptomyces sp. DSM 3412]|uniref:Transposase n=1 Tax=Streptomyces gottesmaniae TaxID=3075518 RepID=A0ABU2Z7P9_9ACTN|nr:transposase [Streptomyces sp. DSM 3412]MDT0572615.1 transposase [Streptomyces sp. DSM 3412]